MGGDYEEEEDFSGRGRRRFLRARVLRDFFGGPAGSIGKVALGKVSMGEIISGGMETGGANVSWTGLGLGSKCRFSVLAASGGGGAIVCAIVRSVALSRSMSTGFGRKHIAPDSSAQSRGDQADNRTTRAAGSLAMMWREAVMPLSLGIQWSIKTRSGLCTE